MSAAAAAADHRDWLLAALSLITTHCTAAAQQAAGPHWSRPHPITRPSPPWLTLDTVLCSCKLQSHSLKLFVVRAIVVQAWGETSSQEVSPPHSGMNYTEHWLSSLALLVRWVEPEERFFINLKLTKYSSLVLEQGSPSY